MLKRTFEGWTDQNIALLRKLVEDGASATEAGIRLGCSRSAAMGKASRLGLVFHSKGRGHPASTKIRAPKIKVPETETVSAEIVSVPVPLGIPLEALTETTCRWPLGHPTEETFGFCGNDSPINSPYCNFHHRIAYTPRNTSAHGGKSV